MVKARCHFFNYNHFFAHPAADFGSCRDGIVVGFERAHDFQQLHLVNGIEEVHSDAAWRAIRDG